MWLLKELNIVLLLTGLLFVQTCVHCDQLKSLFVVIRHGMRAPFFLYENDPVNKTLNETFPNGFGELTEKGKQQMLDVAAFLQTNYTEFLAGKLTDEIEIKSGDQGRLIDSAKLLLKGLKPKDECDQVDSIYVGPVSGKMGDCPQFSEEFQKQLNSEYGKSIARAGKELYESLPVSFSKDMERLLGGRVLAHMLEVLNCEYDVTGKWPDWLSEDLLGRMRENYARNFNMFVGTRKQLRLFTGLFWGELYSKIKRLISTDVEELTENSFTKGDNYPTKKLNAYLGVLEHFGPSDPKPVASTTLIFELHQLTDDGVTNLPWDEKHHIRILLFNETSNPIKTEPHVLKIAACAESEVCTVKTFFAFLADMRLDYNQWLTECAETSRSAGSYAVINYWLALAAFLLPLTYQLRQAISLATKL